MNLAQRIRAYLHRREVERPAEAMARGDEVFDAIPPGPGNRSDRPQMTLDKEYGE